MKPVTSSSCFHAGGPPGAGATHILLLHDIAFICLTFPLSIVSEDAQSEAQFIDNDIET